MAPYTPTRTPTHTRTHTPTHARAHTQALGHTRIAQALPAGHPFARAQNSSPSATPTPFPFSAHGHMHTHTPISALYCARRPSFPTAQSTSPHSASSPSPSQPPLPPHLARPTVPASAPTPAATRSPYKASAYACAFPNCSSFSLDSVYSTDSDVDAEAEAEAKAEAEADAEAEVEEQRQHAYELQEWMRYVTATDTAVDDNDADDAASGSGASSDEAYTLRTPRSSMSPGRTATAIGRPNGPALYISHSHSASPDAPRTPPLRPRRAQGQGQGQGPAPASPTAWLAQPLSPRPVPSSRAYTDTYSRTRTRTGAPSPPSPIPLPTELAIFDHKPKATLLADIEYISGRKLHFPFFMRRKNKKEDKGEGANAGKAGKRQEEGGRLRKGRRGSSDEDEYIGEARAVAWAKQAQAQAGREGREGNWI